MNKKIYKIFGIILIILTFAIIAVFLFSNILDTRALTRGYGEFDYFYDIMIDGIFPSLLIFILGFFPGIFFLHFSKKTDKPNKIVKYALVIQIISVIATFLVGSIFFFSCINGCYGIGEGLLFVTIGIPSLIIYCIGIVLLLIYKFVTKTQKTIMS